MDTSPETTNTPIPPAPVLEPVIPTPTPAPTRLKKNRIALIAGIIAFGILAGALWFTYGEQMLNKDVVAIVDGEKIMRAAYDENLSIILQGAAGQGLDVNSPEIQMGAQTQALDMLISSTILLRAARADGFVASEEAINEKYAALAAEVGGAETLASEMTKYNLTEEKLRSNIAERIIVDQYLEANTDIEMVTITPEEIGQTIEALRAQQQIDDSIPADQLSVLIENQLRLQKQQALVGAHIDALKLNAEIKILIPDLTQTAEKL